MKIKFQMSETEEKEVIVRKGHSILRAAQQGKVGLRHKCGGRASCTTCKVIIEDQSNVSDVSEKELRKLGDENIANKLRLSCQTEILGDVTVQVPEDPYKARIRALLQQQKEQDGLW